MRFSLVIILIFLFSAAAFLAAIFYLPVKELSLTNSQASVGQALSGDNSESQVLFIAVGDIMLSRGVQYKIDTEGQGDFLFPFLKIAPELNTADVVFGNLEGPISDKGDKVGSAYSFRAKPEVIAGLVFAGFDVLSLANNHMFDYQRVSLEETMRFLAGAGIDYIGAGFNEQEAFSLKIKEAKGVKIGFLAYTDLGSPNWRASKDRPGIAWIDDNQLEEVKQNVGQAVSKVDILVVSLHSGEEYSKAPTDFQISFAKACIDSGASLVIEHHPHVVQRLEQYRDGWIAYSLGNFVFDQYFSEDTMESVILRAEIQDRKIKAVSLEKVQLNKNYQPEPVE